MLRFLSRRKNKVLASKNQNDKDISKHTIICRVLLLDGTDLSVQLSVSLKHEYLKISTYLKIYIDK